MAKKRPNRNIKFDDSDKDTADDDNEEDGYDSDSFNQYSGDGASGSEGKMNVKESREKSSEGEAEPKSPYEQLREANIRRNTWVKPPSPP